MGDINDKSIVGDIDKGKPIFTPEELKSIQDDSLVEELLKTHDGLDDHRQALRSLIEAETKYAMDEEIKKAKQELITEQRKAITELVEESKSIIRELVGEEKTAIYIQVIELRKSLLLYVSEQLSNHNM